MGLQHRKRARTLEEICAREWDLPCPATAVFWRWLAARRGETATRRVSGLIHNPVYHLWERVWYSQQIYGWPADVDLRVEEA
jgi:hypothetical protein